MRHTGRPAGRAAGRTHTALLNWLLDQPLERSPPHLQAGVSVAAILSAGMRTGPGGERAGAER